MKVYKKEGIHLHSLKQLATLGICGIILSTQPSITYMTQIFAQTASNSDSDAADDTSQSSSAGKNDESSSSTTEKKNEDTSTSNDKQDDTSSADKGSESASSSSNKNTENTTPSSDKNSENTSSSSDKNTGSSSTDENSSDAASETAEQSSGAATSSSDTSTNKSSSNTNSKKSSSKSSRKKSSKKSSSDDKSGSSSDNDDSSGNEDSSEKEVIDLDDAVIDEDESAESNESVSEIVPEIYGTSEIITKDDAEYISDFVYFNQTDSMWNDNGYQIASAGCGPTSMAIVISSLTDEWVTPLDAAVWGYEHGYYSSDGSSHYMIAAMASAYGLECEGVGTDYKSIKKALKKGHPVVVLMGPGYFTKKGHFMVLVDIDKDDNVTVADVASRERSSYKYSLSDIISQSKSANAGGPFWVISNPNTSSNTESETETSVTESSVTYSSPTSEYVIYVKENGEKKQICFHIGDKVSYNGTCGLIIKFEHRKAYILGENGEYLTADDGSETIRLSELSLSQSALNISRLPQAVCEAVASAVQDTRKT